MFKFLRTHKKREEKQQNTARKEKNLFTYAREPETREKKQQRRIESFIDFFPLLSSQLSSRLCVLFSLRDFSHILQDSGPPSCMELQLCLCQLLHKK